VTFEYPVQFFSISETVETVEKNTIRLAEKLTFINANAD